MSFLEKLPESLKVELSMCLKKDLINNITLFKGQDESFLRDVALHLTPVVITPGDYIFREGDEAFDVFGFNFISPEEYHYLFGPNTEEVLDDLCPVEWVGSRIVTPLGSDRVIRVVPDRLTYLAAARARPSELFANNWERNQQWREVIVTGQGAKPHEYGDGSIISERVERHLQGLYKAEQAALYNALFTPARRTWRRREVSLNDMLGELDSRKDLLGSYINLLYPQFMVDSDHARGSLEGDEALLDGSVLRRFRQEGVPTSSLHESGLARMEDLNAWWNQQLRRSFQDQPVGMFPFPILIFR